MLLYRTSTTTTMNLCVCFGYTYRSVISSRGQRAGEEVRRWTQQQAKRLPAQVPSPAQPWIRAAVRVVVGTGLVGPSLTPAATGQLQLGIKPHATYPNLSEYVAFLFFSFLFFSFFLLKCMLYFFKKKKTECCGT
jgi:hypothetical protein